MNRMKKNENQRFCDILMLNCLFSNEIWHVFCMSNVFTLDRHSVHRQTHPPGGHPFPPTPQETATAADGTHPTGMHSCLIYNQIKLDTSPEKKMWKRIFFCNKDKHKGSGNRTPNHKETCMLSSQMSFSIFFHAGVFRLTFCRIYGNYHIPLCTSVGMDPRRPWLTMWLLTSSFPFSCFYRKCLTSYLSWIPCMTSIKSSDVICNVCLNDRFCWILCRTPDMRNGRLLCEQRYGALYPWPWWMSWDNTRTCI